MVRTGVLPKNITVKVIFSLAVYDWTRLRQAATASLLDQRPGVGVGRSVCRRANTQVPIPPEVAVLYASRTFL